MLYPSEKWARRHGRACGRWTNKKSYRFAPIGTRLALYYSNFLRSTTWCIRSPDLVREVPHADTCGQYRAIFDCGRLHIFDYADYTFCAGWQVINSCLTNNSGSPLARILLHSHPPKTGQQTQRGGPCLESFINVSPEIRSCNPF